jgi:exodeoxyribonuclease VII large subunit
MEKITLSELQEKIGKAISRELPGYVWITAEIGEIKEHPNGHCYLELVEYSPEGSRVEAKARAVIWNTSYKILKPYFQTSTGSSLQEGMHLLMKVQVQYSDVYGLNLVINDIDPSFTVGELELQRHKIKERGYVRDEQFA